MPRVYHRTADRQPTPTEMRRRRLAQQRTEMIAEYERLKHGHRPRAAVAIDLVKITAALIATEIKPRKAVERPAAPVADLFAR